MQLNARSAPRLSHLHNGQPPCHWVFPHCGFCPPRIGVSLQLATVRTWGTRFLGWFSPSARLFSGYVLLTLTVSPFDISQSWLDVPRDSTATGVTINQSIIPEDLWDKCSRAVGFWALINRRDDVIHLLLVKATVCARLHTCARIPRCHRGWGLGSSSTTLKLVGLCPWQ